jgi:dUTP pyrophosphatase
MRKFEKVERVKDIDFNLPRRKTKHSAGYDFEALYDYTLKPNEIMKIPTGIKASMESDDVLFIIDRSSMGFKYNVRMCNQVGVIDADYYDSANEGHIWIKIQNEGDKDYIVKKGDAICQGIFTKFLTVDDEEEITNIRQGGLGSTNREEK